MSVKFSKTIIAGLFLTASTAANAGTIDPNSVLLDEAGATLASDFVSSGTGDNEIRFAY